MEAVEFNGFNLVFGKDQKEYQDLPGHMAEDKTFTMCMELDAEELAKMNATGRLWFSVLTFGSPLQPIRMSALKPEHLGPEEGKTLAESLEKDLPSDNGQLLKAAEYVLTKGPEIFPSDWPFSVRSSLGLKKGVEGIALARDILNVELLRVENEHKEG